MFLLPFICLQLLLVIINYSTLYSLMLCLYRIELETNGELYFTDTHKAKSVVVFYMLSLLLLSCPLAHSHSSVHAQH